MLNDLKRTLLSIKEHKKDSILIFIIILIITSFMMIYWIFYLTANKMSQTIKDNVKITIQLSGGFLDEVDSDTLSLYLDQNKLNYNFYLSHIKKLQNIYDNSTIYKGVTSCGSVLYLKSDNNLNNDYKYIYSYNENAFQNDNYQIVQGKLLDGNNDSILINEVVLVQNEDGSYSLPEINAIVTFTSSNGDNYSYKISGFFAHIKDNQILNKDYIYDFEQTTFILPYEELYKMTNINNVLYIKHPTIKIIGIDNANKLVAYINKELTNLEFIKKENKEIKNNSPLVNFDNYSIQIDDSLAKQLEKPIDNIKILFQVISIFMIVIMFILLSSFILYILNSRVHDFGILIALGQNKIKIILNFLTEIFTIALLAFIIAIPLSNKLASIISNSMISANLKRQERIAIISNNQDDMDIFKATKNAYKDYHFSLTKKDYLIVFSLTSLVIFISQISVLIIITSIKPKQLLKSNQ